MPSGFLDDTFDELGGVAQDFMRDTFRAWEITEDPNTPDPYDTTEAELYGPNTDPHQGKASVSEDVSEVARTDQGGESLEADAVVTLPLIQAGLEARLLDKECEATFRGRTKTGRITGTRRRDVTVQVLVEWG
jgi:hypothetical protein